MFLHEPRQKNNETIARMTSVKSRRWRQDGTVCEFSASIVTHDFGDTGAKGLREQGQFAGTRTKAQNGEAYYAQQ